MDKLHILAVNDGSTDNTGAILSDYADKFANIQVLEKENEGSKFAALNHALKFVRTPFVGCLDADSFVTPMALRNIMSEFHDSEVMSVIPTMIIHDPKNILQYVQRVEYEIAILARRIFHILDAIYITPGPFSFFRTRVFEEIGDYREAYGTEDCEIALRMQKYGMKIVHARNAIVSTQGPSTIMGLHRQRVRWTRGFISNAWDYRDILFNRSYGEVGFSVVPSGFLRLLLSTIVIPFIFWSFLISVFLFLQELWWMGSQALSVNVELASLIYNMQTLRVFLIVSLILMIIFIFNGRLLIGKKNILTWDTPAMVLLYNVISPLWAIESWYRALVGKKAVWR